MSQKSIMWETGTAGDGLAPYTETEMFAWLKRTFVNEPTLQGVLPNYGGDLVVSGTASPLSIATGAAIVNGIPYENDAVINSGAVVTIPTPVVGPTAHRIVLRADYAANTVRAALLSALDGISVAPAVTQNSSVWEITLATLSITTGGVITVAAALASRYIHFNTKVDADMLDDNLLTGDIEVSGIQFRVKPGVLDIGNFVESPRKTFFPVIGGYNHTDSTAISPTDIVAAGLARGLAMPDAKNCSAMGQAMIPSHAVAGTVTVTAIVYAETTGNIYVDMSVRAGPVDAAGSTYTFAAAAAAVGIITLLRTEIASVDLSTNGQPEHLLSVRLTRDALNGLDTLNATLWVMGFIMTYDAL